MFGAVAAAHEHVVLGRLIRPQELAGVEVERHDGVGERRFRRRRRVAGAEVERAAHRIDRRRIPDAAGRRAVELHAVRRFFFHGFGSSAMQVFQICLPVFASSATTLPRDVQHG